MADPCFAKVDNRSKEFISKEKSVPKKWEVVMWLKRKSFHADVDTCQRDSRWIARENEGGQMSVIREESRWV